MWNWKVRQGHLPFTEEQIRARAYELWQKRNGREGSSEKDWHQAIEELNQENSIFRQFYIVLKSPYVLVGRTCNLIRLALSADNPKDATETLKAAISALGLAATIFAGFGLFLTYKNGQEQQRISQSQLQVAQKEQQINTERLMTDRFGKAIEQLGSKDKSVRIGGIYSLERIATDSPKDHRSVMEVLTSFIRSNSPTNTIFDRQKQTEQVGTDIQSALTVIGRREIKNDVPGYLNLSNTNLTGAVLDRTNLQGVILRGANLQKANLLRANLQGVDLSEADLQKANLLGANLQNAYLSKANLQGANLT